MDRNRHTFVITEGMMDELRMTEYKFNSNIKKFLKELLTNPVKARPTEMLQLYGFNRNRLLSYLLRNSMIEKNEEICDKDGDGNPRTATMKISFKVPKKNFDHNLKKMYIKFFENNDRDGDMLTEDGEGATSCVSVGGGDAYNSSGQVIGRLNKQIISREMYPYTLHLGEKRGKKKRKK